MTGNYSIPQATTAETGTMQREPITHDAPALQDVLDALDDADCRTIFRHLDEPMTVKELTEACDIPQSTMYRKLDLLTEASLVEEQVEVRTDGRHTKRYSLNFEEVELSLTEDREVDIDIERPSTTPDERLSVMWSEVRKET